MSKIELDKYYTSKELAKYCIDKTYEIIGEENISEVIEPSAGNGSFSLQIPSLCWAYDIEPEHESILKQDFLNLDIEYLWGRLFIGNPPFGTRSSLAIKFFKKAIQLGDYIAFILPISQYKNAQMMYEFDLIYSEDLGIRQYSGIEIHCCFNIYKRPANGELNKTPPKYNLQDVEVVEFRRGGKYIAPNEYDFGMCTWGSSCGKQVEYQGQYAQEHYIIIKNPMLKDKIMKLCNETDWKHLYPAVSSAKLQTWKIYKHIKDNIPEIS